MKNRNWISISLCFFILSLNQHGQAATPWLPDEGQHSFSATYIYQSFDEFWRGKTGGTTITANKDSIDQWTVLLRYDYSFTDALLMSFVSGYTEASFDPATLGDNTGRADSTLALQYLLHDEFASETLPISISTRVAGILAGNYDRSSPGNPHAPGDQANGLEFALQVGKYFDFGLAPFAEFGYRVRASDVPNDFFYNVGAIYALTDYWNMGINYVVVDGLSGADIGGAGVTPLGFHGLEEDSETFEFSTSVTVFNDSTFQFFYGRTVDGRNTGEKDIFALTYQFSFFTF